MIYHVHKWKNEIDSNLVLFHVICRGEEEAEREEQLPKGKGRKSSQTAMAEDKHKHRTVDKSPSSTAQAGSDLGKKRRCQESETHSETQQPKKQRTPSSEGEKPACDSEQQNTADTAPSEGQRKRKRKKKNKNKAVIDATQSVNNAEQDHPTPGGFSKEQSQQKVKRKRKGHGPPAMSDERLKAYGINPKKFKYTQQRFLQQTWSGSSTEVGVILTAV